MWVLCGCYERRGGAGVGELAVRDEAFLLDTRGGGELGGQRIYQICDAWIQYSADLLAGLGHRNQDDIGGSKRRLHDAMQRCLVWAMDVTDAVLLSLRYLFTLSISV